MIVFVEAMVKYGREMLLERQYEGIAKIKARGKYKGRVCIKKPENFAHCYNKYISSGPFNRSTLKQFSKETYYLKKFYTQAKRNRLKRTRKHDQNRTKYKWTVDTIYK